MKSKVLIVYAHPYEKSFNAQVKQTIVSKVKGIENMDYEVIDLNNDNFIASMNSEDLRLYNKGESKDPLVEKYQEKMADSDYLFFIFPIWWNAPPAIIKGFQDKVLLKGFAFTPTKIGLKPRLKNIKKCFVITTSGQPTFILKYIRGNYIKKIFIKHTLNTIGVKNVKWKNMDIIYNKSESKFDNFLKGIEGVVEKLR